MMIMKKVTLIRHAQSQENVALQYSLDGLNRCMKFESPTPEQYNAASNLLFRHDKDADVSELGQLQINDMKNILLHENYWEQFNPTAIYCSSLMRARKTCEGVLTRNKDKDNIIYLECLKEATPFETIVWSSIEDRIQQFENELMNCNSDNILIVGHSQYFKRMLKTTRMLRNCDVVHANLSFDQNGLSSWDNIRLIYRTSHAAPNPWKSENDIQL